MIRRPLTSLLLSAVLAGLAVPLHAQQQQQQQQQVSKGPPNALQGFSQNHDQPVHIDAASLEVRDKQKQATFSGNVHVVQGDTDMRCKTLVVFYEQDDATAPARAMKTATPGPGGQQKIKKLEARGNVVVTQKDQTATGEFGLFDMTTNTVTLSGGVVLTQGPNILRGDKLVVDLTTSVSRIESGKNGQGRVQGLFIPGSAPGAQPGGGQPGPRSIAPARPF